MTGRQRNAPSVVRSLRMGAKVAGSLRMAWSLVWRMVACGLVLGVSLGTVCGAVIGTVGTFVGTMKRTPPGTGVFERLIEVPIRLAVGIPLGAIAGAALGSLASLVLSVLCGLALFAITQAFFFGRRRSVPVSRYRAAAGWTCAAVTFAALFMLWAAAGFDTDAFAVYPNPAGTIDSGPLDLVFVTILPTLIAASAAWYSGSRVAEWWARGARDPDDANNQPVVERPSEG